MTKQYSYKWYVQQFEEAQRSAKSFILSVDEDLFLQPPAKGKWSAAECYNHLIQFGNLYLYNLSAGIANATATTDNLQRPFKPRWIVQQVLSFFAPPYKIKIPTLKPMEPDPVSNYNQQKLLDEYLELQNRFITQLNKAEKNNLHLNATRVAHPVFSFLSMTLSECFAVIDIHQRRHHWQAKQTLEALQKASN
ncbi:DinB superfamily protein [Fodinibius salinus]|uniref:DinB superfamily protein n=1 Tax=Fodinibius salinus TaxID=860790 RepID=A0A5D3YIH9_9BACT|nr:DinB family protein [Fodinibius salinus]TYP92545.1 DinB superfamily protein [Fodinibius salinus]